MNLKERWNKPTTTKQKFYSGLIMCLITTPGMIYAIWYDMVDLVPYLLISWWSAFMSWTVVVYAFRNDFKDQWKKEKNKG